MERALTVWKWQCTRDELRCPTVHHKLHSRLKRTQKTPMPFAEHLDRVIRDGTSAAAKIQDVSFKDWGLLMAPDENEKDEKSKEKDAIVPLHSLHTKRATVRTFLLPTCLSQFSPQVLLPSHDARCTQENARMHAHGQREFHKHFFK